MEIKTTFFKKLDELNAIKDKQISYTDSLAVLG